MEDNLTDIIGNLTDLVGNITDVEDHEEEEGEGNLWFSKISIQFLTTMNSISLVLAVFALILFAVCRVYNKKFFERMSLRIIGCLLFSAAGFHVAFIYSLYYADTLNCQISTFMYCFFSLVHCFLTTGLGCNLFIIFVLKREAQDYLFWVYWCVAVIGAGAFSLPPPFMNIITFFEVDGCWFDDVKHSWTFYYGPMFVMAVVNIILGVAVHTMLMIHRKEMAVLSKDVEERAELQYFVAGAGDGEMRRASHGKSMQSRSQTHTNGSARRSKKTPEDELRSVAIIVNLYVAIPFICEFATAVTESLPDYGGEIGALFQTFFVSSMGIFTFLVICFDKTLHRSLRKTFWKEKGKGRL